jgi:glycosyltransferase involved in cell wall biosynthesis
MTYAFYSPDYYPTVGGLSEVVDAMAESVAQLGHTVVVITQTPGSGEAGRPFRVERRPTLRRCRQLVREADHLVLFNFAFGSLPCWVGSTTPMTVIHNGAYPDTGAGRFKVRAARLLATRHLAVSRSAGRPFEGCAVMPMPFQRERFANRVPYEQRTRDLLFVGRLVSQKGAHILLEALALARQQGAALSVTIAGDGPERGALEAQAQALGVPVSFVGWLSSAALAECLNAHRTLVVPSVGPEGFGLVVLEGLAAGCLVLAADSGGLAEAVGPCGHLFTPGDARALCRLLLDSRGERPHQQEAAILAHLNRHTPEAAARMLIRITRLL